MTQCPNGHNLHDLAAYFCSQCGERIATERFPPLTLAPVERYGLRPPSSHLTRVPEQSPQNGRITSRLSEMYGSIRRRIQKPKPKVRILQRTTPQPQRSVYPQFIPPQMPPQTWQSPFMSSPIPFGGTTGSNEQEAFATDRRCKPKVTILHPLQTDESYAWNSVDSRRSPIGWPNGAFGQPMFMRRYPAQVRNQFTMPDRRFRCQ